MPEKTEALKSKDKPEKAVQVDLKKAEKLQISRRNRLAWMAVGLYSRQDAGGFGVDIFQNSFGVAVLSKV